jgi:hypothetical protein
VVRVADRIVTPSSKIATGVPNTITHAAMIGIVPVSTKMSPATPAAANNTPKTGATQDGREADRRTPGD